MCVKQQHSHVTRTQLVAKIWGNAIGEYFRYFSFGQIGRSRCYTRIGRLRTRFTSSRVRNGQVPRGFTVIWRTRPNSRKNRDSTDCRRSTANGLRACLYLPKNIHLDWNYIRCFLSCLPECKSRGPWYQSPHNRNYSVVAHNSGLALS